MARRELSPIARVLGATAGVNTRQNYARVATNDFTDENGKAGLEPPENSSSASSRCCPMWLCPLMMFLSAVSAAGGFLYCRVVSFPVQKASLIVPIITTTTTTTLTSSKTTSTTSSSLTTTTITLPPTATATTSRITIPMTTITIPPNTTTVITTTITATTTAGDWKLVGNGFCLDWDNDRIKVVGEWIETFSRLDGSSELCERLCNYSPYCIGYMTEDHSRCKVVDYLELNIIRPPEITRVDGETRNDCWIKRNILDNVTLEVLDQNFSDLFNLSAREPVSLKHAIFVAEHSFNMSYARAAQHILEQCRQTQLRKYPRPNTDYYQYPMDLMSEENIPAMIILKIVELQLPLDQRANANITLWKETMRTEQFERRDDHNDCTGPCAMAGYAILPYPTSCLHGGSISDDSGCAAPPVEHRPEDVDDRKIKLAVTAIYSGSGGKEIMRGMCGLLRSACYHNVSLHLLHTERWKGLGMKVEMMIAFLEYLVREETRTGFRWIVMLIDAYDTLLQVDEDDIKRRFLQSGQNILISGESNCFPWAMPFCNMGLGKGVCSLYEQGERRYPNAGGYIGYAQSLLELMNTVRSLPASLMIHWPGTDQGLLGQLYLTHAFPGVAIDTISSLWATFTDFFLQSNDTKGVSWAASGPSKKVRTLPPSAALHFNGAGTYCFYSVEAAAWYNTEREIGSQTGTGECPYSADGWTFLYEYNAQKQKILRPLQVTGFYRHKCNGFQCSCGPTARRGDKCECSPDAKPIGECAQT